MLEEANEYIELADMSMDSALTHLRKELTNVRAGKANPSMLTGIHVEYYGSPTPLNQVSNVSIGDARTLVISPWEKKMLPVIEKAIFAANIGFTPQNNGEVIRIHIPPLTQERRRSLVKRVKGYGETAKVSIRQARREANDAIKILVKDGLSEDFGKDKETEIQELTKQFGQKIDKLIKAKEEELMSL